MVPVRCAMKKNKLSISVGDLVCYCPHDMHDKNHDIGIIYDICESKVNVDKKTKIYKIFWSRGQEYDDYPESGFYNRLKMIIRGQSVFKIIKMNE